MVEEGKRQIIAVDSHKIGTQAGLPQRIIDCSQPPYIIVYPLSGIGSNLLGYDAVKTVFPHELGLGLALATDLHALVAAHDTHRGAGHDKQGIETVVLIHKPVVGGPTQVHTQGVCLPAQRTVAQRILGLQIDLSRGVVLYNKGGQCRRCHSMYQQDAKGKGIYSLYHDAEWVDGYLLFCTSGLFCMALRGNG